MKALRFALLSLLFQFIFTSPALAVQQLPPGEIPKISDLTIVFANALGVVSSLAGFATLIMLIRGGVAYITAQGDPKAVAAARSSITYAIIGFLVILASYLIISFLWGIAKLPGLPVFCVPGSGRTCP